MRIMIMAGAAALALVAVPGSAQSTDQAFNMSQTQQQMFMTWPDDRRIMYTRWPADVQAYYWTLTPQEQTGWWVLTDDQRVRLHAMTPDQRVQAWTAINAQVAGNTVSTATTAATTMGNIRWVSNAVVQSITPDQAAPLGGKVPICGINEYDNCMNAWEAGKRGPSVTRPLDYWPGKPASEM